LLKNRQTIRNIEKKNYLIAAVCLSGSLFYWSREITLGVFFGFLVVTVNFKWLLRILETVFEKEKAFHSRVLVKLIGRIMFVVGSIAALLVFFKMNLYAFLLGTTTILLAILGEVLVDMSRKRI
jgi:hypothetical protein